MQKIMKDGLEWSQKQMNTRFSPQVQGHRIAGQEIPILTNTTCTRAQDCWTEIPILTNTTCTRAQDCWTEIPILTNTTCTRAQDCWTEIPIFDLQKGKCLIQLCKMLDTKAVVGPPSAMRTSDHTTEIWDMPRLNGYI